MDTDSSKIHVARIYDVEVTPGEPTGDILRILVDRLWPRGVSREKAAIDLWPKDATPSTGLRTTWHNDPNGHDPDHFAAFQAAYRDELAQDPARTALADVARAIADAPGALLLTATKSVGVSHVPVFLEAITHELKTLEGLD